MRIALAVAVLVLSPVTGARATSTASDPVTRAVAHGVLDRRVTLDAGAFRAEPARHAPATAVSRRDADLLERSTDTLFVDPGSSGHLQRQVVLSYVTVNASRTSRGQAGTTRDTHPLPTFHHRLAWVVFEKYEATYSCPLQTVTPTTPPLPRDDHFWRVFLVDAQDDHTALQYDEPLGGCRRPSGKPQRHLPLQYSDVAWTLVGADTIQVATPDCGRVSTITSDATVTVTVATPLAHLSGCTTPTQTVGGVTGASTAAHGHIGLRGQPA